MSDNVVDLSKREKKEEESPFDEVIRKNKEKQERLKKEREKANAKVKREYRLKGKD